MINSIKFCKKEKEENIKKEIFNILSKLKKMSLKLDVYIVGGLIRNIVFQCINNIFDIDLIINRDAYQYSKKIAENFQSKLIILDNINHVYRIILSHTLQIKHIDITLIHGRHIQEDLLDRDFTINALAFKLSDFVDFNFNLIFPYKQEVNVLADIQHKVINTVSSKAFIADPLRMIRVFRFMANLQCTLTQTTIDQIIINSKLIYNVSHERIKNEFCQILSSNIAFILIQYMYKYKLLQEIFPELKNIANANKKYYFHTGGLLHHLFETMKSMEHILNNLSMYFPDNYINLQEHFDNNISFSEYVTRRSLLKFVALFHDNAKPETVSFKNNKMHFIGHEHMGAIKIKQLMASMKFGKKDIEFAMFLIKNHMRPSNLTKTSVMTKKSILKFFRDIQDRTPDLLVLSMADWYSYKVVKGFSIKSLELQEYNVKTLLNHYYQLNNIVQLKKIIDGNVIMKKFNLRPGPYIGQLLKFIENVRDEGLITTTEEALELLKTKIESKS